MAEPRRIDDLTQEELMILTDEEVGRYIELEIACQGITPVDVPVAPSIESAGITADVIVYEVGTVLVADAKSAKILAKLPLLDEKYEYRTGYDYKWVDPVINPEVKEKSYYRQKDVVRVKHILVDNERMLEDYKSKKNKYDKYLEDTGQIRNYVWKLVNEVRDFGHEVDLAKTVYAKHLELAGDDTVVAERFFRDAYKEQDDIVSAILGKPELEPTTD